MLPVRRARQRVPLVSAPDAHQSGYLLLPRVLYRVQGRCGLVFVGDVVVIVFVFEEEAAEVTMGQNGVEVVMMDGVLWVVGCGLWVV